MSKRAKDPRIEGYEHRLNNAQAGVCDAASAYCWNPTPEGMEALRDAVGEWRTSVGLWKLNTRKETARFQDYDRAAERRYESWLESTKDHGP